MSEPRPTFEQIIARVAWLEAQVTDLQRRVGGASQAPEPPSVASTAAEPPLITVPALPPLQPPPLPATPRPASKPLSPVVFVAGAGAVIFLLGALFFLHWSIQQGWIGPEIRFLMGLVAGAALTFGAAKLLLGDRPNLGVTLLLAGLGTLMFTLRFGAFAYQFFPPTVGFMGTFAAVILAGALGARAKHGGALAVALATGFITPLVFSEKPHREVELALYLAVLQGAALVVPYVAGVGARWGVSRWMSVILTWVYLLAACAEVQPNRALPLALLLLANLGLTYAWIWLPGCKDEQKPSTPTVLWVIATLAFTGLGSLLWRQKLHLMPETYALVILAIAALNLALVKPLRLRMDSNRADFGLLALAFGHLALAVPVALAWRWVGPVWGCFALGMAWAATRRYQEEEDPSLSILAWGLALAATLRWLVHGVDLSLFSLVPRVPFANALFLSGLLASCAWALLCRSKGVFGATAFALLQLVAGLTISLEMGTLVHWAGGSLRLGQVIVTLAWALLGALQWLRSLSAEEGRTAFTVAGYGWLGLASFKLLTADLAGVDTPKRALAFLGVGVIFLAAALVGNHVRRSTAPGEDA